MSNSELSEYRKNIDKIDSQIMSLLDKRFNEIKKIGDYKKLNNIPIENTNRENEIIDSIIDISIDKSNKLPIKEVYKQIFKESKNLEK